MSGLGRQAMVVGAALLLSGLAPIGCFDTNCGKPWEGPIPDGTYRVAEALAVGRVDEAELAAIQETLTIEVVDGETLLLSYIEPSTRTLVVLEYAIEPL